MNRTIKFRAWDAEEQRMREVGVYGGKACHFEDEDWGGLMLFEKPVMQFTGLTDKNGKEIYEGDVIEFTDKWEWYRGTYSIPLLFAGKEEHARLKAKYEAEPMHRFAVEFDPHEGYNLSKSDLLGNRYAVIGNIYENPDLLS